MRVPGKSVATLLALVIALGSACLWWAWSPPWANELVSGDEAFYGNMGRNVLESGWRYLVSPSQSPDGPPGDKPPLYPALLAISMRVLGVAETGVRAPSFALAVVTMLALGFLVGRAAGPWAGVGAVALLATLPWFADASRAAAAEIPTTTFGLLALLALAAGRGRRRWVLVAGLLLGLAFLCKLWLVAPFVLAGVAMLDWKRPSESRIGWLVGGALLTGLLQAAAVLLLLPDLAGHWLYIYLGRSLLERAAGSGYEGGWVKAPRFYWALLVHATMLFLPLACFGIEDAVRRWSDAPRRGLLVWAAGVGLLSVFAVKSGVYAYVVVPAWAGLAALGAHASASGRRPAWGTVAAGLVATMPWLIPSAAGQRLDGVIWAGAWLAALVVWFATPRRVAAGAAIGLALLAAAGGFARAAARLPVPYNRPGLRDVAEVLRPRLHGIPRARVGFVSPEAPVLVFYLDRLGEYWWTPQHPWSAKRGRELRLDPEIRGFVVDTSGDLYGGGPDSASLAWLQTSTTEITGELRSRIRHATPLRVFVRADSSRGRAEGS